MRERNSHEDQRAQSARLIDRRTLIAGLSRERLEALYGAPVHTITDATG
jgi:hypothetical protein